MMMKRILIMLSMFIFFGNVAYAKVIHQNYKATFGIFGTVGYIKNKISKNSETYKIVTTVNLEGVAKVLLGGQKEYYVSKGHMKNGLMISDFYEMTTTKGKKKKVKTYTINHKKKYVTKRYRKYKDGKLIKETTSTLNFYAKDDLLTLYFNLGTAVTKKGKTYHFKAVGLEKQQGKVQITVPNKAQQALYVKDLGEGASLYAKALIVQKNFKNKKGDILLSLAKDGYIQNTVIKDLLLYGDAKITRLK